MSGGLWLLGAGNMGGAILRGWLASGIDPAAISVIDPGSPALPEGIDALAEPPAAAEPDIVLLAVKPQLLETARGLFAARGIRCRMLISILAGVEVATLKRAFAAEHIVRTMPNLPASIGKGVTALFTPDATPAIMAEADRLMAPLGRTEWLSDEAQFDAVTALSGSGPGFFFRFIDAMAEAGAALGLERAQALRLAIATAEGSAALAASSPDTPAELARKVASPGGTTQAGLDILDRDGAVKALLLETLAAAKQRSAELAKLARG